MGVIVDEQKIREIATEEAQVCLQRPVAQNKAPETDKQGNSSLKIIFWRERLEKLGARG